MVRRTAIVPIVAAVALGVGEGAVTNVAEAGMFDMINPSRWFGGDHDRYYDRYRYGYGPGYWGGGGPYGWGGPYGGGWGGPWGGGGWPGYYGGYGGYGYGRPIVVAPSSGSSQKAPPPKLPE